MAQNARRLIEEKYDWRKISQSLICAYEQTMNPFPESSDKEMPPLDQIVDLSKKVVEDAVDKGSFLLGYVQSPSVLRYYIPNPRMAYPVSFGTEVSRSYYGVSTWSNYTRHFHGTRTFTGDGYGSIILPSGTYNNVLICFTDTKIYRIEGYFNDDGTGSVTRRAINDEAGLMSHLSIVKNA
jgi:hypothetical protein